jgi:hypothetical protein
MITKAIDDDVEIVGGDILRMKKLEMEVALKREKEKQ